VISGFNTDVECAGTVYHVQTEDKGSPARVIMSLVYDKGTILASKRVSYEDLAALGDFDEKILAARVSRQHKLICAAVQAGRIEELKKMTAKKAASVAKPQPENVAVVAETEAAPSNGFEPPNVPDPFDDIPIIDGVEIIEELHEILPDEAVAVVSELSGQERLSHNKLDIHLLGEPKFKGGDRRTVNLMVCRGTGNKVVADAQIMVKVLGSSFRPVIFHARSDANGLANVHLQLPKFDAGRAALLVRAIAGGEEIELRRIVTPG
jgi:hypothetical protein